MRRFLKQGQDVLLAVGKPVGKFETVISLNALNLYAFACIPTHKFVEEVGGGVGGLLWICSQETQSRKLINGGVLEQAQLRIRCSGAERP